MREQALEYKEYGWAAYKIHPPTRWQEDIKVCEAVRKAVGDYTIMLEFDLGLRLPGGAAGRPRGSRRWATTGTRTRCTTRTSTTT